MNAVIFGHTAVFKHFLDTIGDHVRHHMPEALNPTSIHGHSMCALAVLDVGDIDTLRAVIDAGYDVNVTNQPKKLAAIAAIEACQVLCKLRKVPSILVDGMANVPGATSLFIAAYLGNPGAVQVLLDAKADPEVANCYGRGPLIAAAMRGHSAVVQQLMRAGANVATKDTGGRTAAQWAAARGYADLAEALRTHEANASVVATPKTRRGCVSRPDVALPTLLTNRHNKECNGSKDKHSPS